MSKEKAPALPDGLLAIAVRKREGRFEVFSVRREAGKQVEEVLKSTDDKRIAAHRLEQAVLGVRW